MSDFKQRLSTAIWSSYMQSVLHLPVNQAQVQPQQCCTRGLPVLLYLVVQRSMQLRQSLHASSDGMSGRNAGVVVRWHQSCSFPDCTLCAMLHTSQLAPHEVAGRSAEGCRSAAKTTPAHRPSPPAAIGWPADVRQCVLHRCSVAVCSHQCIPLRAPLATVRTAPMLHKASRAHFTVALGCRP